MRPFEFRRALAMGALVCAAFAGCSGPPSGSDIRASTSRISESIDEGWAFKQSDVPGAEQTMFDDAGWKTVSVPHDWSIAGPFDPKNPTEGSGGFLPSGIGWYRRPFHLVGPSFAGKRVFVEFDGVMANSDVWINGVDLGHRPYGYASFAYELTGNLSASGENMIAVRVDDSGQPASRWYTGAGIIRHVRLVIEDPVHVARDATFVTTPQIGAGRAIVHVHTTVTNQSGKAADVSLRISLTGPDGSASGSAAAPGAGTLEIDAGKSADVDADIAVNSPVLWDLDRPALYRADVQVLAAGSLVDEDSASFGIRDAKFVAATGFWLNGRNVKLKGVCVHGDGGAFGAAVPLGVWRRRLAALKELGANAIRTAHNPPDPGFLDLCDSMGFLVMDEAFDCWTVAKRPFDYHLSFNEWSKTDVRDMVRRDRNHPSIVLWSAGNEIHDTPQAELSKRILSGLMPVFHENDPTRPVTQALLRPNVSHDYDDGLAALLDVVGTNYRDSELLAAHAAHPEWKIVATESHQSLDSWRFVRDNAPYSGQFLWVGIDYLGESPRWPFIGGGGDQTGLLDRTGSPKPTAFQRQSWWSNVPMVHIVRRVAPEGPVLVDPGYGNPPRRRPDAILSDWTPVNAAPHAESVEVYSNAASVELFLNGRSLGVKPNDPDGAPCKWQVPFEAGSLRAIVTVDGKVVATHELHTAGAPARIALDADSAQLAPGWDNVDFVRATVVDAQGIPVPGSTPDIVFQVTGPGAITAVDNADNSSHESFQVSRRHAFRGSCFAVLRASGPSGTITLTASSDGLLGGQVKVEATPP
jgi:beta-galactosidase